MLQNGQIQTLNPQAHHKWWVECLPSKLPDLVYGSVKLVSEGAYDVSIVSSPMSH
jgi:hypothetical protein